MDENEKPIISVETEKTVNSADRDGIAYESEIDESRILIDRLLSLGLSNHNNDKIEEAIKNYKEAVQIANKTDHNDLRAKAYQLLGNVYTANSQYMKAIEFYQKANEIYPDHKWDDWELAAYMWLGYSHLKACQYKECIEYYNVAVKIASQLRDGRNKLNANLGLGNAFKFTEEYTSSQKYYLEALMAAEQINDKILQRDVHMSLGHAYYQSCKFDAALSSYLKAYEISHYLGENKKVANACFELGYTFQQFVNEDQKVFNFASRDVYKNAATKMLAILNKYFCKYIDSIGLIACGTIRRTCFLVTDEMTNLHVCTLVNTERKNQQNPILPITAHSIFIGQ